MGRKSRKDSISDSVNVALGTGRMAPVGVIKLAEPKLATFLDFADLSKLCSGERFGFNRVMYRLKSFCTACLGEHLLRSADASDLELKK